MDYLGTCLTDKYAYLPVSRDDGPLAQKEVDGRRSDCDNNTGDDCRNYYGNLKDISCICIYTCGALAGSALVVEGEPHELTHVTLLLDGDEGGGLGTIVLLISIVYGIELGSVDLTDDGGQLIGVAGLEFFISSVGHVNLTLEFPQNILLEADILIFAGDRAGNVSGGDQCTEGEGEGSSG